MNSPANDNALTNWTLIEGEALAALATIPSVSVDAVIVDSPYCSGGLHLSSRQQDTTSKYQQGTSGADHQTFADQRDQKSYMHWCCLWLSECLRVAKPGAPLLSFVDWRQVGAHIDSVQAGGWTYRGLPVWDKTTMCRPRMGGFRAQSELIVWATKGSMVTGDAAKAVGCLPGVFRFPISKAEKKFHTTQKPIALMEALVAVCAPGGLVFDPFAGSGSTGVAALNTGRRFIGIELSPEYAAIARQRLSEAQTRSQSSLGEQLEAAALPDRTG